MAHTYEELHRMTVDQLREIAVEQDDERLQGNSQMNKDHLLPLLCEVLGIEAHAHHEVVGIEKRAIKDRIKAFKADRDKALKAHDKAGLKQALKEALTPPLTGIPTGKWMLSEQSSS